MGNAQTGLTGTAEGQRRPGAYALAVSITDKKAMDRIQTTLDGVEWSPDTLDEIANLVRKTGRTIADIDF